MEQSDPITLNNDTNKNQTYSLDKTKLTKLSELIIDGSMMEGGGQILRISLALSLIFNKKIKIEKIRGGRENPGLKNQHLASVLCLKNIFKSEIIGAEIKSENIIFEPILEIDDSAIDVENIICDCGSAGSIGLMIQQLLPCLVFANCKYGNCIKIKLKGGTLVNFSPSTFYLNDVLKVILAEKMNLRFDLKVERHGIFPAGGGVVELSIFRDLNYENFQAEKNVGNFYNLEIADNNNEIDSFSNCCFIKSINVLNRGNLKKVLLRIVHTKNLNSLINLDSYLKTVLKEIKKKIVINLKLNYSLKDNENMDFSELENLDFLQIETIIIELPGNKPGYTLFTNAIFHYENTVITAESLLSEKKSPTNDQRQKHKETFLNEVDLILSNRNICFDEYTVDHLIIFMGLAKGNSRISVGKISLHTLTAIEILKKFFPDIKINIVQNLDMSESNIIEIHGIGA